MKVVIVGGVAAGMSCASKLRRLDKEVQIDVFEKTQIISYSACGIPYYVGNVIENIEKLLVRSKEEFEERDIHIHLNSEVVKVDTKSKVISVKSEGETKEVDYDILVIASGANPIRPDIKGSNLKNIFNVKTIDEALDIKNKLENMKSEEVIIVGGGYIGMEMAEALHNWKKKITIIEMGEHVLNGFDKEIQELVEKHLIEKGIKLRLGEKVQEFIGQEKVSGVRTDKGEYSAEMIVLGMGFSPATAFLKDSEIQMGDNGAVVIDRLMRTNVEKVYAAGDCAQVYSKITGENTYIPLGTNANKQGKTLASIINGDMQKIQGTLGSAVIKILDIEVGKTGLTEKEAEERNINCGKCFIKSKTSPAYYPKSEDIYVKIVYNQDNRKIIGGQIFGKRDAGIRTDIIAAAILGDLTVDQVGMLDLCYAPPFSNVWDAINIAANSCE